MSMIRTAGPPRKLPDSAELTGLPVVICERLAGAGVRTPADWLGLGDRRFQLWGVTKSTVALIDRVWGRP